MKPLLIWEEVSSNQGDTVFRAKIPGGWLVNLLCGAATYPPDTWGNAGAFQFDANGEYRNSLCFVPDPSHQWQPLPEPESEETSEALQEGKEEALGTPFISRERGAQLRQERRSFELPGIPSEIAKAIYFLLYGEFVGIEDFVYDVRNKEGKGWEGEQVVEFGRVISLLKKYIPK